MKFEIKDNTMQINLKLPSNKTRHLHRLKQLIRKNLLYQAANYIESFNGSRQMQLYRYIDSYSAFAHRAVEGRYLDLYNSQRNFDINHSPAGNSSDWIGVEIECMLPEELMGEKCCECEGSGVIYDGEDHEEDCNECDGTGSLGVNKKTLGEHFKSDSRIKFTSIKSDNSLRPDRNYAGVEITVLTRLSDPSNLQAVCETLTKLGAKVNKSCGLHVHLDQRDKTTGDIKRIGKMFSRAMPVMVAMVPEYRRSNTYCKTEVSGLRGGRYYAVNLTAFSEHKTIEVRLHSATTDFNKIMNWARFMKAISVANIPKECKDINALTDYVDIDQELLEYIGQRTALFSPSHNSTSVQAVDLDATDRVEPLNQIDELMQYLEGVA